MVRALLAMVILCVSNLTCSNRATTRAESLSGEPIAAEAQREHDERIELPAVDLQAENVGDQDGVAKVVQAERESLALCFGDLGGELLLQLELRSDGSVLGGSTEPAGGEEGLAAVADCVLNAARNWRFPSGDFGGTRILIVPLFIRVSDASLGTGPSPEGRRALPAREASAQLVADHTRR